MARRICFIKMISLVKRMDFGFQLEILLQPLSRQKLVICVVDMLQPMGVVRYLEIVLGGMIFVPFCVSQGDCGHADWEDGGFIDIEFGIGGKFVELNAIFCFLETASNCRDEEADVISKKPFAQEEFFVDLNACHYSLGSFKVEEVEERLSG